MPKLLQGVIGKLGAAVTHEGAAAYDLSTVDPLHHLVFTKGAAVLAASFYRTQVDEVFSYSRALLGAERHERGFGWKFAAYMRDPKKGKGNRIQGSLAPAILAAADPDGPYTERYVGQCLSHRADDVVLFACHFVNLGMGDVPAAARRGMAHALNGMDAYQILKYAPRQYPLITRRDNGKHRSLRLVDAMGMVKEHLAPLQKSLYDYLHAPTRERADKATVPLVAARRRYFRGGDANDFAQARLTIEQALSHGGKNAQTWRRLFDVPGLFPDVAFKQYVRAMAESGIPIESLVGDAQRRTFQGLWPHQVFGGYLAAMQGVTRKNRLGLVRFRKPAVPAVKPVFEAILDSVSRGLLPAGNNLGIADISGSMFAAALGGEHSSVMVGHVAILFSALMSDELGYAATFSDDIFVARRDPAVSTMDFALELMGEKGWGATQVTGSVLSLILQLQNDKRLKRPRTLFFFSDMQFHPPATEPTNKMQQARLKHLGITLDRNLPPLQLAIEAYRKHIGPVDVVLWNLAAYDAAPLPSNVPGVLMLAGFDANSFRHITTWQAEGSKAMPATPKATIPGARDPNAELDFIRTF